MSSVYLLQHCYEEDEFDWVTDLGIYTTNQKAIDALNRFKNLEKFLKYPDEFIISEYLLNENHWEEGFTTYYY